MSESIYPALVGGSAFLLTASLSAFLSNPGSSPKPASDLPSSASEGDLASILCLEPYFPSTYLSQADLEEACGVSAGKFTKGLGQSEMCVTGDAEDSTSMALTALSALMRKHGIDPNEVGRLEVGTESLTDKSKSIKTSLSQLFPDNKNLEGATNLNACYGGTAALLNCFNHVSSPYWDGRLAICVVTDVAVYAAGPARPTSGAGAVAVAVGRGGPLVYSGVRGSCSEDNWDFYKPLKNEYPVVDGANSQECYYRCLKGAYEGFKESWRKKRPSFKREEDVDFWCFHAPYNKLVKKSFARLAYWDDVEAGLGGWREEGWSDREFDKEAQARVEREYQTKFEPSNEVGQRIGNTYAASVFMGLCGLVESGKLESGQTVGVFSYGSGSIATMYQLAVREPKDRRWSLQNSVEKMKMRERLDARVKIAATELDTALDCREVMCESPAGWSTYYPKDVLFPDTYYLINVDEKYRRQYKLKKGPIAPPTAAFAPAAVTRMLRERADKKKAEASGTTPLVPAPALSPSLPVTGVAVGLPGHADPFAASGLDALLSGKNMIAPIPGGLRARLLEKNVYQVKKVGGESTKVQIDSEEKGLKLAAQLAPIDLGRFGVSPSLAGTLDTAASIAVGAGLLALRDAGLVKGAKGVKASWVLAPELQASTGVIYITSFPGLDATVDEVMRFLQSKTSAAASADRLVEALRSKFVRASISGTISDEDEAAFARLRARAKEERYDDLATSSAYAYDRKFLFKVLCLGNSQLAQIAQCKGPNCQVNTACSGTTTGLSIASDWIRTGRCERVVVIAGDSASSDTLLPFIGNGFVALGAACTKSSVEEGARPFDEARSGMIVGSGGVGIVLESPAAVDARLGKNAGVYARLVHSQFANSAYHGAAMNSEHIASELERFLASVEDLHGITKEEIAEHGCYYSHETSTNASETSSCSYNEISALRSVFGDVLLSKMCITNTKGFTGHSMGCSFEDAAAIAGLKQQRIPPVVNMQTIDPNLGDLKLSEGGAYAHRYSLRLGAGFGSQVAWALYTL
mmetsp:Transcript_20173/g.42039  ORF Transcript_20173/g.42039 Transcript_20173/m.42039 type:complete len:1034 (+) Transcript_20173:173-3274(+)